MPNKNFVEDMLTLGSGLLSNLVEARHELAAQAKQRAADFAQDLDLVSREEFDAAFAMLAKARGAQEDLSKRLAKIEAQLYPQSKARKDVPKPVKTKKTNLPSVKTSPKRRAKK